MPTYSAKVSDDGSVVLPAELRERLGIEPGSEVEFFLTVDGQVHFHCVTDTFTKFRIPGRRPPISVREIDDIIADEIAEKVERSQSTSPDRDRSAAE
jgi:AbrB family looped-hinge helix DNA binding protein